MLNGEKITKTVLLLSSLIIILIASGMVLSLMNGAMPAFNEFGLKFIISTDWNPTNGRESYGALPFIVGTLLTSIIALIIFGNDNRNIVINKYFIMFLFKTNIGEITH